MAHDISNSLDLAGIQALASAALPSAQKAAANGVASLNASTKVVERLAYEGVASGVATLNAASGLTLTQLLFPASTTQTVGFTASTAFSLWVCNSNTVGSFNATLPTANTVPNGFRVSFINLSPSGANSVTIITGGGNSLIAQTGATVLNSGDNPSVTFITDGVNTWYQIV